MGTLLPIRGSGLGLLAAFAATGKRRRDDRSAARRRGAMSAPMPARDRAVVAGLALLLLATPAAWSAPSHDATSHRRFDDPAYWSTVFDDPARAAWQKPEQVVAALGLRPGQCVADLGAGTGYFSRPLS